MKDSTTKRVSTIALIMLSISDLFAQHQVGREFRVSELAWKQKDPPASVSRTPIALDTPSNTGQWVAFKNWNEGRAVVAESDSIVWVGTAVGLVRWNVTARTYQTFDETNGLPYTSINGLAIDRLGHLWIATTKGVVKYASGVFTVYNYQNANLPNTTFSHIAVDSTNRIYATYEWYVANNVRYDGGVAVFNGTSWKYFNLYNSIGTFGPSTICVYHDTVWIGAFDNFYILDGDSIKRPPGWGTGWPWTGVYGIAVDHEDTLWILTTSGKLMKYKSTGWQTVLDRDSNQIGQWYAIWKDPNRGLWFSNRATWPQEKPWRFDFQMYRNGTRCFSWLPPGYCKVTDAPGDFVAHHARRAGLQFFVYNYGLIKFNGTTWEQFLIPRTLYSNEIRSLGCSPSGDVYVNGVLALQKTNGMQWDSLRGGAWINPPIRFRPDGTLWLDGIPTSPPRYVTGLDFDGYGAYWGAYGSIMTLGSSGFREWTPRDIGMERPPGYFSPQFMDIAVDKNEFIWATGWYNGTVMFDRTNWHPYYASGTILPNGDYDRVFADSKNRIWFGTNQWSPNYGFSMFDGTQWRTFYSPQRYSISYVYQFTEDNFGNVWLATGGGLLKYDGSSFTVFDSDNSPMNTNYVSAVAVDFRGNIWVGTNSGLYVYNPSGVVELGPYSFTSPVDSFSVLSEGKFAKAIFRVLPNSPVPIRYQLQRGRGIHKFWTIAEAEFSTTVPPVVEIRDTSTIIGQYYYRIREVAASGKVRHSTSIRFTGGSPGLSLLNFDYYLSGKRLFLRWYTRDEQFLHRFELWRRDSVGGSFVLAKIILPDSTSSQVKHYEIEADSLRRFSPTIRYSLRAVYADSTRSELRTLDVTLQLPLTFRVSQNYPNPFNSSTTFDIEMPSAGFVTLKIFDLLGREVSVGSSRHFGEGYHKLPIDMSSLASGVYIYAIEYAGARVAGKLVLLK